MKPRHLINFAVSEVKKKQYQAAAEHLGITVSEICRKALDNAVILSEKLKTSAPSVPESAPLQPHEPISTNPDKVIQNGD